MSRTTSHRFPLVAIDWWHDLQVVLEHAQEYTIFTKEIGLCPSVKYTQKSKISGVLKIFDFYETDGIFLTY